MKTIFVILGVLALFVLWIASVIYSIRSFSKYDGLEEEEDEF